ncbi:MAG: Gfo/Idh/MocA family oxidoreductase [Promethearchaeota archaeon]|nr:MAG: Gfo/Idh/MocA family oxidoreductase [Candidatus Lokiarchaeota archaeon]
MNFGIIGCGGAANDMSQMVKALKRVEIIAACDPILSRACKVAGEEHSYKEVERMYENENLDAVYLAVPHHLHGPMIKQALENGLHVFCEKPVANTIESAREILRLDKKYSNLKVGINYQHRYDYNCRDLALSIQNGHLGKNYYAIANGYFNRERDYFDQGPWRASMESSGGGTLLIQASHILDIMIWAFGDPLYVTGKIDNLKFKDIEVEDTGFGIIEFKSGSYGQISNTMITSYDKPRKSVIYDRVEMKVVGEKGSCYYEGPWPLSSLKWSGVKKFIAEEMLPSDSFISIDRTNPSGAYGECLKAFSNWILDDTPFLNTIEESSKVLLLVKTLYKSSKTGKKERVEKL